MHFTPASSVAPNYELLFPPHTMTNDRGGNLTRQAHILEYASFLAANYRLYMYTDEAASIASQVPQLASVEPRTTFSNSEIELFETQLSMSSFFNARIQAERFDKRTFEGFRDGLFAFEEPKLQSTVIEQLDILEEWGLSEPEQLPNHLGSGYFIDAYLIDNPDGPKSVLKVDRAMFVPNPDIQRIAVGNIRRWLGLIASKGIDCLEQPIAFSAERNVLLTKYAPGRTLKKIIKEGDKFSPTDNQQLAVAEAVAHSIQNGVEFDPHTGNIIYDEECGFTILDSDLCTTSMRNEPNGFRKRIMNLRDTLNKAFADNFDTSQFTDLLHDTTEPILKQMES